MKKSVLIPGLLISLFVVTQPAFAGTEGLPWEDLTTRIANSLSGPWAIAIGIILMVGAGLMLSFGEWSRGVSGMLRAVFGLAITFNASTFFIDSFFAPSQGAAFGPKETVCEAPAATNEVRCEQGKGQD